MARPGCLKGLFWSRKAEKLAYAPFYSTISTPSLSTANVRNNALKAVIAIQTESTEGFGNDYNNHSTRNIRLLAGALSFSSLSLLLIKESEEESGHCEAISGLSEQLLDSRRTTVEDNRGTTRRKSKSTFFLSDDYRRRIFFNYERRLRMCSSPEKVFDYFASIITSEGRKFMSAGDLMRAVVPVFPPSESSLVRDGHLSGERSPGELCCPPSSFFMLFDTNGDGLISFSEYIFFLTLLSIPEHHFSAAFKMFDMDGNGMIDREEFKKIMGIMRGRTRQGTAQRNGCRLGLKNKIPVENGGLVELFFGKDGKQQLRHEDFEIFLKELKEEIVRLEFSHYDFCNRGSISAKDLGLAMVAAADLSHLNQYLDRVDALGNEACFKNYRISFEEFRNFSQLRKMLSILAFALRSFGETCDMLTKADFQRAASQVCQVTITDSVVDIIFYIFDINCDGNLSVEEFLGALDRREQGVTDQDEFSIVRYLKCCWDCAHYC
eukprot:c25095_g1_i1 orf=292-1770(+)